MSKRLRVPDYDVIVRPHELLAINTPTFQRLFRIYQLGLGYLVYPFATHTRGAHVVETVNFAQRILDSLKARPGLAGLIDDDVVERTRMGALLHDIAHLPFSHTLEDENVVFKEKHDEERLTRLLDRLRAEIAGEGHRDCRFSSHQRA